MTTGPSTGFALQQLEMVKRLIESCLHLYMTQKEVVEALLNHAKVEPLFTKLVWRALEEENRAFFQAYHLRLIVKQQITEFNKLLGQQVLHMQRTHPTRVSAIYNSNGPHLSQIPQSSSGYAPENKGKAPMQENMYRPMGSCLPNVFGNGSSSLYNGPHAHIELPTHASTIDAQSAMLSTRSLNMGPVQGIKEEMVKTEPDYSGSPAYMFGAQSDVLEAHTTMGDMTFSSVEPSTQPLNDPIMGADTSSFGILGLNSQCFSLPVFPANLSPSSDILENNPGPCLLGTDNENFQDSCERERKGYNGRLEPSSEESCNNGDRNE